MGGAQRHYAVLQPRPLEPLRLQYDPRLLAFEFAQNVMLRAAQVRLVRPGGPSQAAQRGQWAGWTANSSKISREDVLCFRKRLSSPHVPLEAPHHPPYAVLAADTSFPTKRFVVTWMRLVGADHQ